MPRNIFRDMSWGLLLVFLILNCLLWSLTWVTRTWEYRAVYHMDCQSFAYES